MGTTKVTIRRTAKKKDGSSKGTVKTTTKTVVSPENIYTAKTRKVARKGINVNYIKSS